MGRNHICSFCIGTARSARKFLKEIPLTRVGGLCYSVPHGSGEKTTGDMGGIGGRAFSVVKGVGTSTLLGGITLGG